MQNRNVAACSVGFLMRDGFFNQFSKILLTFLQRRNQFCPIKQTAKESLVNYPASSYREITICYIVGIRRIIIIINNIL